MFSRYLALVAVLLEVACSSGDGALPIGAGASPSLDVDRLRCAEGDEKGRCMLYDVSLYDLITRPAEFHGKRVRVIGFAHFEFEGNGLYAHREDWERSLSRNGVWVDPPPTGSDSLNNRYLLIEGRFDAKMRGHMSMWSGSLDSVTRYFVWELSPAPRDSSAKTIGGRR
jgi:hypothetical protein